MAKILKSRISGLEFSEQHLSQGNTLKAGFFNFIQGKHPGFSADDYVSISELNTLRKEYLEQILKSEFSELSGLESQVLAAIQNNKILSEQLGPDSDIVPSFGQRLADKIASFGGSWSFIIVFFSTILLWIVVNIAMLANAFDPYPFILLNLVLSCLASIQAPIIMMSQNRQEDKDRERAEKDYKINLKAELEVRLLHDKIDHMLLHQNQRLFEIQELQTQYLHEIMTKIKAE